MRVATGCLIAACMLMGCDEDAGRVVTVEADTAPADTRDDAGREEKKRKEKEAARKRREQRAKQEGEEYVARLEAAVAAFRATTTGESESRIAAYKELIADLREAQAGVDTGRYDGFLNPGADTILKRLDELGREEQEAQAEEEAVGLPDQPKLELAKYSGAFRLSGTVKKCHTDGVAIKSGRKYYFIKDAVCPDRRILYGYVEDALTTVMLDIGRDGREAKVVTISDKESAQDDRRSHRALQKEQRAEHQSKLKAYRAAVNDNRDLLRRLKKEAAARATETKKLRRELDKILEKMASSEGMPPPPSSAAVAADAPTQASSEGMPPAPSSAAVAADAPTQASSDRSEHVDAPPAFPKSAPPPPKPRKDRAACLRGCLAACNDDANCERSCAAQKCR
ncbi:hypothetical protein JYT28_00795 [Desulfobulbus sp. AH-315-M07]|nr:hypothetical protein [Desulfobulbus sp. AH-315-M07]